MYQLISPRDRSQQPVTESVSLDKKPGALFAFLDSSQMGHPFARVFLRGLDPKDGVSREFHLRLSGEGCADGKERE